MKKINGKQFDELTTSVDKKFDDMNKKIDSKIDSVSEEINAVSKKIDMILELSQSK